MTNNERMEEAAKKVLQLVAGGLSKMVTFERLEMPDGRKIMAICFNEDKWLFDGQALKVRTPK